MNIKGKNSKEIRTADLALAAAISLFYPLEAIDRKNPQKALFIFKRNKDLDALIENYWRGELKSDLRRYFEALRIIKARLYAE